MPPTEKLRNYLWPNSEPTEEQWAALGSIMIESTLLDHQKYHQAIAILRKTHPTWNITQLTQRLKLIAGVQLYIQDQYVTTLQPTNAPKQQPFFQLFHLYILLLILCLTLIIGIVIGAILTAH